MQFRLVLFGVPAAGIAAAFFNLGNIAVACDSVSTQEPRASVCGEQCSTTFCVRVGASHRVVLVG